MSCDDAITVRGAGERGLVNVSYNSVWPPRGWPEFTDLENTRREALDADRIIGVYRGMAWDVSSSPVKSQGRTLWCHHIALDYWEFEPASGPVHWPYLDFLFTDRPSWTASRLCGVQKMRAMACDIPMTKLSAGRMLSLALFCMKQIALGRVPLMEKTLHLYHLHPAQLYQYRDEPDLKPIRLRPHKPERGAGRIRSDSFLSSRLNSL